ncbi:MAG TPA: shikimate dehydrogenase [Negativicutes bacterium]|nr:shikimate dehydrogenase [Negativicutes bacterium]
MTSKYGLIGERLGHSFSPQIHNEILKRLDIDGEYMLFELSPDELFPSLSKYREQGIKGLNITVPYKIKVMSFLDSISEEAEKIGAVNTISLEGGLLKGYNTDYYGFGMSLAKNNIRVAGKSAVILGTGGVSRAVSQYLRDNGAGSITYISRNPGEGIRGYDELESLKGEIIINCTPCGMYPGIDCSPVGEAVFDGYETAVDLIYNPEETLFLRQARKKRLKTMNGLYMLVGQAVCAQEIWNGRKLTEAQADEVYQCIRDMLYKTAAGESHA